MGSDAETRAWGQVVETSSSGSGEEDVEPDAPLEVPSLPEVDEVLPPLSAGASWNAIAESSSDEETGGRAQVEAKPKGRPRQEIAKCPIRPPER